MLDDLTKRLLTAGRWALIVLAGAGLAIPAGACLAGLAWMVWRWVG